MKFALAFTALAYAAEDQAPVISLNLEGAGADYLNPYNPNDSSATMFHSHGSAYNGATANANRQNTFADSCEVSQNHGPTDPACTEPHATVYDDHDDAIAVQTSYVEVSLAPPGVCVEAGNYLAGDVTTNGISWNRRGEWVIKYEAMDTSGNEAETLTFAMILTDTTGPVCGSSLTPKCRVPGDYLNGYMRTFGCGTTNGLADYADCSVTIELCQPSWTDSFNFDWIPAGDPFSDAYDNVLPRADTTTISLTDENGVTIGQDGSFPSSSVKSLTEQKVWNFEVKAEDYAGIFGAGNMNNIYSETGTITLTDTTAPVMTTVAPSYVECGVDPHLKSDISASYVDCFDDFAGRNDPSNVVIRAYKESQTYSDSVLWAAFDVSNTHESYYVQFDLSDSFGNQATPETKFVEIKDTLPPTLLIGETSIAYPGSSSTDSLEDCAHGTVAGSTVDGDVTSGHCETMAVSANAHTFSVQSLTDHTNLASTEIFHSAGYASDYTFIEELTQENVGWSCEDACSPRDDLVTGAQWAEDGCDGATGEEFAFNMKVVGDYFLVYQCTDVAGFSVNSCRTIHNVDKTKPVITVKDQANNPDGNLYLEATNDINYVDAGATCSDIIDGTISNQVQVSGDVVNMAVTGTYVINYDCSDLGGNEAPQAHRTVVIEDTTCPTCVLTGDSEITVEASFPYSDAGVVCSDTLDGEINPVLTGTVDVEQTGTYSLTFTSTDSEGNNALCPGATVVRTVTVSDTLKPTITLNYYGSDLMAENGLSANGWAVGAVASAVSGVALLGYAATRKAAVATSVPV